MSLRNLIAAFVLGLATSVAAAAEYPARTARIVVPYVPGGSTDILARLLAQKLTEALGQQFIVDNRAGGGGNIGAAIVAKASPDGHSLLMATNGTHAINPSLYKSMPFDAVKDFVPVILVAQVPLLLVTNPSLPVKNVRDLMSYGKSNAVTFGSASTGSSGHLAGEMLKAAAGINATHVPYKGDAQASADLIGGQISFLFANMPAVIEHVRANRLRGLAVSTPKRSPAIPDLPTMTESGVAQFEVIPWYGIMAPAGTPPSIVAKLNSEIERVLKLPDIRERMASLGAEPLGGSPERFAAQIRSDIAKYAPAIKASGAQVN